MSSLPESPRRVPKHRVDVLAAKAAPYAIVVFVIDEGDRVRRQLQAMAPLADVVDVVVADGGSTDGSLDLPSLASWRVRALLTKEAAGRLSAQMRIAFDWALEQGYEGVITIDGNGKDDVSAVPDFVRLLDAGVDHVQGSRFIRGGRAVNTPAARLLGVRLLHAPLISLAARRWHTDTTNGFRAYSRRLLDDERVAVFRDVFSAYELHYHLAIESSRDRRFCTAETPVTRVYPAHGAIPTKIHGLRGNLAVLRQLARAVTGRFRLAA